MEAKIIIAGEWVDTVSKLLQRRWPSLEARRLDEVAFDLYADQTLREMPPEEAARRWLEPVMPERP